MTPTPTKRPTWSAMAPAPAARAPAAAPPPSTDPLDQELETRRSKLRERFRRAVAKTKD
jgi:hypothetical protein